MPGWASLAVLLSFLNGVIILIVSMLGEYTVRLLNQTSQAVAYQVKAPIGPEATDWDEARIED